MNGHRPLIAPLYVPADRPDRIVKALASGADAVFVDLEDAVAPDAKNTARAAIASLPELVAPGSEVAVQIRVNAESTPWHEADVDAVAELPAWIGLRLPKAESVDLVARLADKLPERALHLLIESALGLERAFDLARSPQVASLGMGAADLKADLRVTDEGLAWASSRIVTAARAAGLPSPLMPAFTHVTDLAGLAASCRTGRAHGFLGRSAIHPGQLDTIRAAFRPTLDEVSRARLVLDRMDGAVSAGTGALQLADGTFLDLAMVESARDTIALAELF